VSNQMKSQVLQRGDAGYEEARQAATWHAGTPNRFPAVIVQASNEDDVVAAVHLAKAENLKVGICSGGHSWSGSHLRDGILLLNVSELKDASINAQEMTAMAQPGLKGSALNKTLLAQNLFFPTGHCSGPCLGGYLLQGGFAWRGREFGPSCMSVTGVDVVTADGTLTHADERQNADLFWAARGAGAGFFGAVTRFYIKLYPRSRVTLNSNYVYPLAAFEKVYRWVHEIGRGTAAEVNVLTARDESLNTQEPVVTLNATAFAESEEEARAILAICERCPARPQVLKAKVNEVTTTAELTTYGTDPHYQADKHYLADNLWTHASFDALLPGLRAIIETFPPAPSHLLLWNWGYDKAPKRPSMAYSLEDDFYYALYAAWDSPGDDEKYRRWVTEHIRALEPLATGIQLADENLINRPARFVTDDNLRRLDQIRAVYDPDGLFVSWLGRPTLSESSSLQGARP
jgi:FAD/FMN-containing dehydrogenase